MEVYNANTASKKIYISCIVAKFGQGDISDNAKIDQVGWDKISGS